MNKLKIEGPEDNAIFILHSSKYINMLESVFSKAMNLYGV